MKLTHSHKIEAPSAYLVSEKLDGARAHWDGAKLTFRSGDTIHAPPWFLEALPPVALIGELWAGRGAFNELIGTIRSKTPDEKNWRRVRFVAFDIPDCSLPFARRAGMLADIHHAHANRVFSAIDHDSTDSIETLNAFAKHVISASGEGLMMHRKDATNPGAPGAIIKVKALHDAEAKVIAHEPGKGKHAGRLGALVVETLEGIRFNLGTGLTDAERLYPPQLGTVVTYTYRELTPDGVPRFASYLRPRDRATLATH